MDAIVGYTGFVGSNLCSYHTFAGQYNSKNIKEAFGSRPELLVYSGVPAEMFLANKDPEGDLAIIKNAIENIKKIMPEKLVLISTVAVYPKPNGVDETDVIRTEDLSAYGKNRRYLEQWVEENVKDHLIVRLPAIYGIHMKKNFIYDYIHVIPAMLNQAKYEELKEKDPFFTKYYTLQDNGFYRCGDLDKEDAAKLRDYFKRVGFSALNFTDSRSVYQFYALKYLWTHIEQAMKLGIRELNLAVEPLSVQEVYAYLNGGRFVNELAKEPFDYDFHTIHAEEFGGANGYLFSKEQVLGDLAEFVKEQTEELK